MGEVPESHPRFASLMARKKLTEAAAAGLLADSALIAHGRGEAFDYLLQERTCDAARQAIRVCAASLASAKSPVISVNGNTVALAGPELLACAAVLECPIEVNIYYRTPERIPNLEGPRANCHHDGIFSSDVILVPLEDGDRCEALVAMGKTVCVIDLNPLSRTAKMASITIVDELTRCVPILLNDLRNGVDSSISNWDNQSNLKQVTAEMLRVLD